MNAGKTIDIRGRVFGGAFGSAMSFAVGEGASPAGRMPIADLQLMDEVIARAGRGS